VIATLRVAVRTLDSASTTGGRTNARAGGLGECDGHRRHANQRQPVVKASGEQPAANRRTIEIIRSAAKALTAVTALLLGASLAGCDAAGNALEVLESPAGVAAGAPSPADALNALKQLKGVPVKGRAPKTGYTRDEFGPAWGDTDRNGCDTRNEILTRDLANEMFKPGTYNCVVASGTLADKYTGTTINFVLGRDTSSEVQIDHIVALSDAWQKGAQQLNADQRKGPANDPPESHGCRRTN
jgi:hypothetical protein